MDLGRTGIWIRGQDGRGEAALERVRAIEALGYGTLWVGGSPAVEQVRPFLAATTTLTVATGIVNVWREAAGAVAAQHAALARDFPGRFLLGLGVGHPEATERYRKPLSAMRAVLDALDAADPPVPPGERVLAALGPKMLALAAERTLGTHPYFTPPAHTRVARAAVGPGGLVAPGLAVVLEPDAAKARAVGRDYARYYLTLRNYRAALLRSGFAAADLDGGGSDRLIDAIVPHGTPEQLAAAVRAHHDAGADHVCLQPLGHGPLPVADYEALAAVLR